MQDVDGAPSKKKLVLAWLPHAAPAITSLRGMTAVAYFNDILLGKAKLLASDKVLGDVAVSCFRAAATQEEKLLLTREHLLSNKAQVSS